MYKSPIEKIYGEMQTQIAQEDENMVMKAIRQVGVHVDKEALIKALQYDSYQYAKGYEDGKSDILDRIRAEIAEMQLIGYATVNGKREIASKAVMQVIDKYKAESEE